MTPTARSMALLRSRGYFVARVEQRLPIPGVFITRDAFGLGDLLACNGEEIALVQVTATGNLSARVHKVIYDTSREGRERLNALLAWLSACGRFYLHGWAKRGSRKKRKLWTCRELNIRPTAQKGLGIYEIGK